MMATWVIRWHKVHKSQHKGLLPAQRQVLIETKGKDSLELLNQCQCPGTQMDQAETGIAFTDSFYKYFTNKFYKIYK